MSNKIDTSNPPPEPSTSQATQEHEQSFNLMDLPQELLDLILESIAKTDYYSLEVLGRTCHRMYDLCKAFMERNPASKYRKAHYPAGMSDSEDGESDGWNYDRYEGEYVDQDLDDLDDLNDRLERLSYGSDYDEDIDEYINGPGHDEDSQPTANQAGVTGSDSQQVSYDSW